MGPFRPSLRRQLLIWLLLPQLVLWAMGGLLTYRIALSYAEKAIDQSLTQSVRALARQVKPIGSGLLIDFPRAAQDVLEQDPDDRVSYMVSSPPGQFLLGNGHLPQPVGEALAIDVPRLYSTEVDGKPLRVVALDLHYGDTEPPQTLRVQVGKSTAERQRIARELVADMLAPLLALAVLLSLLVYGGIRRGLRPLTRLTDQLENRQVDALEPIAATEAPREVQGLVQAINALLQAVDRSLRQEKRFLNDAAHQLRTPLAGLISQVELAQREAAGTPLVARLAKVRTGAERSAHLAHQLLTLARTEVPVRKQPFDLASMVREVAREWTPRALDARMDLGYEGPDQRPWMGDELQMREALSNLIDNAIRYSPAGTRITLRLHDVASGGASLEIEDDGPGLPPDGPEHVFQRFWRGTQTAGGCGLGLAIVREIARRHGGDAVAEPVQPHGLRVRLRLP
jgi:two-component system, OmpR family, sensor histidine kinase TctE